MVLDECHFFYADDSLGRWDLRHGLRSMCVPCTDSHAGSRLVRTSIWTRIIKNVQRHGHRLPGCVRARDANRFAPNMFTNVKHV